MCSRRRERPPGGSNSSSRREGNAGDVGSGVPGRESWATGGAPSAQYKPVRDPGDERHATGGLRWAVVNRPQRARRTRAASSRPALNALAGSRGIESVVEGGLCVGCGTCSAACPVGAIEMVIAEQTGRYRPSVNTEKCTRCGVCLAVCPGPGIDLGSGIGGLSTGAKRDALLGEYRQCYLGYSTDPVLRRNSSSGGLATQLLVFALDRGLIGGALVTRMGSDNALLPEPFIATTADEIAAAAGSKLCPVPANAGLGNWIRCLDRKIAVVGLPCQMHAIRKLERTRPEVAKHVAFRLGIFCSGVPSFWATRYVLRRHGVKKEALTGLAYRGMGWPGSMCLRLGARDLRIPFIEYRKSGFSQYFSSVRCGTCIDQSAELADVSLGDAWSRLGKCTGEEDGMSFIVCRTAAGDQLLQEALREGHIHLEDVDVSAEIAEQSIASKRRAATLWSRCLQCPPDFNVPRGSPMVRDLVQWYAVRIGMFLGSKPRFWPLIPLYAMAHRKGSEAVAWLTRRL